MYLEGVPVMTVKSVLVGDSGVGKSSILLSFTNGTFTENQTATIGIDFKVKKVEVIDNASGHRRLVTMQLWDTAGQERFRTLTSSYYRGAHAVVLIYDVNEPQSFYGLVKWLEEARAYCDTGSSSSSTAHGSLHTAGDDEAAHNDDIVYLLIGNKTDRCSSEAEMPVSRAEAQNFARQHRMLFALTSAKTQEGIKDAFDELARSVYDRLSVGGSAHRSQAQTLQNLGRKNNSNSEGTGRRCC